MTDPDRFVWPEDAHKSPCARAIAAWVGCVLGAAFLAWLCMGIMAAISGNAMKNQKLTPWFPADVKPVRDGVYIVRPLDRRHLEWNSMWRDGDWRGATSFGVQTAIEYAEQFSCARDAPFEWRGLAEQPK